MLDKMRDVLVSGKWPRDTTKTQLAAVEFVDEWLNCPTLSGDFSQLKGFELTVFDTKPSDAYWGAWAAMRRANMRLIQQITSQFPERTFVDELVFGWDEYGAPLDLDPYVSSQPLGSPEIEKVKAIIIEELTYAGITSAKVKAEAVH